MGKEVIETKEDIKVKQENDEVEITPLRDFVLHAPPIVENLSLIKGKKVKVKKLFIDGLKSEKVIGG